MPTDKTSGMRQSEVPLIYDQTKVTRCWLYSCASRVNWSPCCALSAGVVGNDGAGFEPQRSTANVENDVFGLGYCCFTAVVDQLRCR
jgi:hypothetical protein